MKEPLRLGLSGSAFVYAMPDGLLDATYWSAISERPVMLTERQNSLLAEFTRDMMRVMSESDISAMECYYSVTWDRERVLSILEETENIEFWSIHAPFGRYIDPSSPDEEAREGAIKGYSEAVRAAARLGAGVVVTHPGANVDYDVPRSKRLELAAQTIREIADIAGELGVVLAVEPLPKQEPGSTLEEVLDIVGMVDHPNVGINFDVNHLYPPEDVPSLIRKAGGLIRSVHISDQDGQERHWLPLQGALDWPQVIAALRSVGYAGPLVYETHIRDAVDCDDVGRKVVENYRLLMAGETVRR